MVDGGYGKVALSNQLHLELGLPKLENYDFIIIMATIKKSTLKEYWKITIIHDITLLVTYVVLDSLLMIGHSKQIVQPLWGHISQKLAKMIRGITGYGRSHKHYEEEEQLLLLALTRTLYPKPTSTLPNWYKNLKIPPQFLGKLGLDKPRLECLAKITLQNENIISWSINWKKKIKMLNLTSELTQNTWTLTRMHVNH